MVFICGLRSEKGVHKLISLPLFWPSLASYPQKPFLAFTDVLEEMWREVTRKVWIFLQNPPPTEATAWQAADYPSPRDSYYGDDLVTPSNFSCTCGRRCTVTAHRSTPCMQSRSGKNDRSTQPQAVSER